MVVTETRCTNQAKAGDDGMQLRILTRATPYPYICNYEEITVKFVRAGLYLLLVSNYW